LGNRRTHLMAHHLELISGQHERNTANVAARQ
jgi:hypothetical protein